MILQALYEYAIKKQDKLPAKGFENKEIKFVIEINSKGDFLSLIDTRENKKGKVYSLPKSEGRSGANSWQTAFLLWDHYGYVLGHQKETGDKFKKMASKQLETFVNKVKSLSHTLLQDIGIRAVLAFYEKREFETVKKSNNWDDCKKIPGCNLSFKLDTDDCLIAQRKAVVEYQSSLSNKDLKKGQDNNEDMVCLITGKKSTPARLHTSTPIIGGKSNGKLVGFQTSSGYDSYGKEQAYNAPVSKEAESAYTRALKYLTNSDGNRFRINDMTVLFWETDNDSYYSLENDFGWYFQQPTKDDPDRGVKAVKNLFQAAHNGNLPEDSEDKFFILGLSPNAARISVRFFKTGTVREFAEKILLHFSDLEIARSSRDREYPTLNQLLIATVFDYKSENIPPNIAGKVMEAVLDGTPYPQTLLQLCIRRIRAERHVNYRRAAILKACLNRFQRFYKTNTQEVTVSLNKDNFDPGYLIGRLFATLEKIQEEAQPNINATIKDRYYGAASSNPVTVFPQLLKLKNHHLAKLDPGRKTNMEILLGEIMNGIDSFPAHLALNDQANFAIGYYHQRQDFFTGNKQTKNEEGVTE